MKCVVFRRGGAYERRANGRTNGRLTILEAIVGLQYVREAAIKDMR